jgi:hypothetical protein
MLPDVENQVVHSRVRAGAPPSRATSRLVCEWGRYHCGELIVQFKREGGWLLVSATRPNASCLVSSLSERQLPLPLRAFLQRAFLQSP